MPKKTRSRCSMCDMNGEIHIPSKGHLSFPGKHHWSDPLIIKGPKALKCPYCKPDKYKATGKKKKRLAA